MRLRHIHVTAVTPASAEAVFALLTDGATWPRWSPIESFELERSGDPPPEGVGAIRVFRKGRTTGRDEILEIAPHRRFAYASRSGLPVRDYVGEIDMAPGADGGTAIHWHSSFHAKLPGTGWILERGLRRFLAGCTHGLAGSAAASNGAQAA